MTSKPLYIEDHNLSSAWAKIFLELMEPGVSEIAPLIVTVTGIVNGRPAEVQSIRQLLDHTLLANGKLACRSVASTIFPESLWNPERGRTQLYLRYSHILPRLKRIDPRNRYGLYFNRLIAFGSDQGRKNIAVNQLDHIISTYRTGNHRRSALQAAIFDPAIDHTNQRQRGFPCLQQIAFVPNIDLGELTVLGFYATQYVFEKAYGNFLGLCALGHFMAHEMGLRLSKMTCIAGAAKLEISKKAATDLAQRLREMLGEDRI